jgi:naringenin degradation protein FdeH
LTQVASGREDSLVRRVVTGVAADGEATILFDGEPPVAIEDRLMRVAEIWATDSTPPRMQASVDAASREWRFEPDAGGTIFRVVTFLAGAETGDHATETLDYLVVVEGEIVLIVGGREVTLHAGDVIVQNGARHEWVNRSGSVCVMAGVLLSGRAQV